MEPFIGQIMMFGGNFAPRGWANCDGQLLAISQNEALFSILGTMYGGDGRTTFGLPDLRSRVPIHVGRGPGLSNYVQGQKGGSETKVLTVNQLPNHSHTLNASSDVGNSSDPTSRVLGNTGGRDTEYNTSPNVQMAANAIGNTGGGQPFSILPPYNTVRYIIALEGIYPPRT